MIPLLARVFNRSSSTFSSPAPDPLPPSNSVAPAISGVGYVERILTSTTGTWLNTPTSYNYQWKKSGSNISGATTSTYVVQLADEGQNLTCVVTAANALGSVEATSNTIRQYIPTDSGAVALWLDPYTASSGSSWVSSNGITFTPPMAGETPTKTTDANGVAIFSFDGSDRLTTGSSNLLRNVGTATVNILGSLATSWVEQAVLFISTSAGTTGRLTLRKENGSTNRQFALRRLDTDTRLFKSASVWVNQQATLNTIHLNYTSATAAVRLDGSQTYSYTSTGLTAGNTSDTAATSTVVGAYNNSEFPFYANCIVYGILIRHSILSESEQAKEDAYLLWRARRQDLLPVGHPWKDNPPV